ncbi:hypothetical protein TUBRATIS_28960 [Tubulinosema ratisbonensis]|uniref:Uncharacterized protein n=1 Tax=Tubulinosema ratisbonensis TaxID=291195 RepID=A0A437AHR1_9MICR|nr:hypothetical protein TUBRATIS_28960 [Tubulinosema ratisbonensis]
MDSENTRIQIDDQEMEEYIRPSRKDLFYNILLLFDQMVTITLVLFIVSRFVRVISFNQMMFIFAHIFIIGFLIKTYKMKSKSFPFFYILKSFLSVMYLFYYISHVFFFSFVGFCVALTSIYVSNKKINNNSLKICKTYEIGGVITYIYMFIETFILVYHLIRKSVWVEYKLSKFSFYRILCFSVLVVLFCFFFIYKNKLITSILGLFLIYNIIFTGLFYFFNEDRDTEIKSKLSMQYYLILKIVNFYFLSLYFVYDYISVTYMVNPRFNTNFILTISNYTAN